MKKSSLFILFAMLLLFVGCGSDKNDLNPENLKKVLNEYYRNNNSECIKLIDLAFRFPRNITLESYNKKKKIFDLLMSNGIITVTNAKAIKIEWIKKPKIKGEIVYGDGKIPKEVEVDGKKLELTEQGKLIYSEEFHPSQTRRKSGALCVGRYEVENIKNYINGGALTADVSFIAKPIETIPGILKVISKDKDNYIYKELVNKFEIREQKKETLILTDMKGWILEKEYYK